MSFWFLTVGPAGPCCQILTLRRANLCNASLHMPGVIMLCRTIIYVSISKVKIIFYCLSCSSVALNELNTPKLKNIFIFSHIRVEKLFKRAFYRIEERNQLQQRFCRSRIISWTSAVWRIKLSV